MPASSAPTQLCLTIDSLPLLLLCPLVVFQDRKSTRLNSSHLVISYAVFCLKKKTMSASRVQSLGLEHGRRRSPASCEAPGKFGLTAPAPLPTSCPGTSTRSALVMLRLTGPC